MVVNITRIRQLDRQLTPASLVGLQPLRVKLVVEKTPLTTHKVGMKVIGLKTVHNGSTLSNGPILKLHQRHLRGVVFIGRKDVASGPCAHARHAFDFASHAQQ